MVVVVSSFRLSLPGCGSLKEKRMVIRSLKDRIKHRFNVSVAETQDQDVWTRAEITVALVATDQRFADSVMSKVDDLMEKDGRAIIVDRIRSLH